MADGVSFTGDGAKDVSSLPTNTQPTVSKSGGGPIEFAGNGGQDCSGVINTPKTESIPTGNSIQFVAD